MPTPSKYDILIYLHFTGPTTFSDLEDVLRRNIIFEDLNTQTLYRRMRELVDSDLVLKRPLPGTGTNEYGLNMGSETLINHLSFLLWCRKDGIDHNTILNPKTEAIIFQVLKVREITREALLKEAKATSKTLKKYILLILGLRQPAV